VDQCQVGKEVRRPQQNDQVGKSRLEISWQVSRVDNPKVRRIIAPIVKPPSGIAGRRTL
jgi:hypothetical protein